MDENSFELLTKGTKKKDKSRNRNIKKKKNIKRNGTTKNKMEKKERERKIKKKKIIEEEEEEVEETRVKKSSSNNNSNENNKRVVEKEEIVEEEEKEEKVKTFRELGVCEPLCESLERLKYKEPTKIQQESLPYSLEGKDIIGLAETGSGKTASFAIPILQKLLENPSRMFALIVALTRELAFQITEHFEAIGSIIGVKCVTIIGGVDTMPQSLALAKRPHIIVATPGRLVWHLENTKGFSLKPIQFLVLDEADKLLNMDFEDEINIILKAAPKKRTTYLYSATMTTKVDKLQRACLRDPVKVEVSNKYQTVTTLQQNYIFIPAQYKECYLAFILNEYAGNSVIIFTTTCNNSFRISLLLRNLGFPAIPLHGKMSQSKRLGALNKFKSGERNILVATGVASRGLDIPTVDIVINYDISTKSKEYIHRVGRTARAGRAGRSITFVTQYDIEQFQKIETLIGKKMEVINYDEDTVLLFLERVNEANRIANMELKEFEYNKKKRKRNQLDHDNYDDDEQVGYQIKKKKRKLN
eukprot:TRINITY_DN776_c1_g1_i1.p1 TRINITY_DN776_c1_g1~~TRINITY_DN776_c1_g1_i1.p1  ORF type:complete len:529 (-),score=196.12 TRINITY_DN776_c1_g1_i1:334-1920(-)